MSDSNNSVPRRSFIATTALAGAAVPALGFPNIVAAQNLGSKTIKIGLIGCGGRGTGAATQALNADPNVVLTAVADAFSSKVEGSLKRLNKFGKRSAVPKSHQFSGLDAYQQLLATDVDVVLLAAPPGFRPQHLEAAIKAGKHVFAEKPMAVDMAGVKSVMASTQLAKQKNLTIQHGFCWRFAPTTRAAYKRVLAGDLGRVVSVYGTYMSAMPKPLPADATKPAGMSDVEWQLRWWTNFEWLSGGPLVEQSIHTVDKVAWAMNDVAPVAAVASGGRAHRTDKGNVYDNYSIAYEYPNKTFCHVGSRQYPRGCHSEVIDRIFCENGTMIGPGQPRSIDEDGKTTWRYKAEKDAVRDMYQVCHNELFAALRAGKVINTGEYMANSTALGLLGREAAHTGKRITWKKLWQSDDDQAPDTLKMSDSFDIPAVPVPGKA